MNYIQNLFVRAIRRVLGEGPKKRRARARTQARRIRNYRRAIKQQQMATLAWKLRAVRAEQKLQGKNVLEHPSSRYAASAPEHGPKESAA